GGDWIAWILSPIIDDWRKQARKLISPLEGEMAGRTEGGAHARHHQPASFAPANLRTYSFCSSPAPQPCPSFCLPSASRMATRLSSRMRSSSRMEYLPDCSSDC